MTNHTNKEKDLNPSQENNSTEPKEGVQEGGFPNVLPELSEKKSVKEMTQAEIRSLNIGDVQDDVKFNLDELAAETKRKLGLEPLVTKYVPLDTGEKRGMGIVHPFTINGYRCWIMKGKEVSVPVSIAALIDNFLNNTVQEDNANNLLNASAEKRRALNM